MDSTGKAHTAMRFASTALGVMATMDAYAPHEIRAACALAEASHELLSAEHPEDCYDEKVLRAYRDLRDGLRVAAAAPESEAPHLARVAFDGLAAFLSEAVASNETYRSAVRERGMSPEELRESLAKRRIPRG